MARDVSELLRDLTSKFNFAVVGMRAVNMYLFKNRRQLSAVDWELLVEGDDTTFQQFAADVARWYSLEWVDVVFKPGNNVVAYDVYNLRSRSWIQIFIHGIKMFDLYHTDKHLLPLVLGVDGLQYSDMGFLLYEIANRYDVNFTDYIDVKGITRMIANNERIIDNTTLELYSLQDDMTEMKMTSDDTHIVDDLKLVRAHLDLVNKDTKTLYRALLSDNVPYCIKHSIGELCRTYVTQEDKWNKLMKECTSSLEACK